LTAAIVNVCFIFSFLFAVYLKHKNLDWICKPEPMDYLIITALGLFISLRVELYALSSGSWFYSSLMPKIFGVGLVPLIQLPVIAIISLIIIRKLNPVD